MTPPSLSRPKHTEKHWKFVFTMSYDTERFQTAKMAGR